MEQEVGGDVAKVFNYPDFSVVVHKQIETYYSFTHTGTHINL